jgi:hypothetical protein
MRASMSRRIAAHAFRFRRPPRPGFALPVSRCGGSSSQRGDVADLFSRGTRVLVYTVIIGHRLRRARACYGFLRARRLDVGSGGASGTNG